MPVLSPRCAGLDVHQKTVVACVMLTAPDGTVQQHSQTFLTMTADLLALADWLGGYGVTPVALESSGVDWHPVFNLLEEHHPIILVNPQQRKAVPGRKTDVKDAAWIADLLRHGLLRPSCIPPKPIRDLRDLLRYRKTLGAPCHADRYLP
jgi:transposase